MKTLRHSILTGILVVGTAGLTAFWCQAGVPSGDFTRTVSDPLNIIWDLSKVESISNPDPWIEDGDTAVEASYQIAVTQDGSGKLKSSGSTTVSLTVHDYENGMDQVVPDFTGLYKFVGSISSKNGVFKIALSSSVSGMADLEGTRRLSLMTKDSVTYDAVNQRLSSKWSGKATAGGLGSVSDTETQTSGTMPTDVQEDLGDGAWTLTMNLIPDNSGKKLTGTATVTLNNSAPATTYSFNVKGTYAAKTDVSKLTFSPVAGSKGSSLKVTMLGSNLQSIQGKVAGQMVKVVD